MKTLTADLRQIAMLSFLMSVSSSALSQDTTAAIPVLAATNAARLDHNRSRTDRDGCTKNIERAARDATSHQAASKGCDSLCSGTLRVVVEIGFDGTATQRPALRGILVDQIRKGSGSDVWGSMEHSD